MEGTTLYHSPLLPGSRAVHTFLLLNDIPFKLVVVDVVKGEQQNHPVIINLKLNVNYSIPVLEDADIVLFDSGTIIRYLFNKFCRNRHLEVKTVGSLPQTPRASFRNFANLVDWFPHNAAARALINEYLDWQAKNLGKHIKECDNIAVISRLNRKDSVVNLDEFTPRHKELESDLKFLEQRLERSFFITGDKVTVADMYTAQELWQTKLWKEDLSEYPKITDWLREIEFAMGNTWKLANKDFEVYINMVHSQLIWSTPELTNKS